MEEDNKIEIKEEEKRTMTSEIEKAMKNMPKQVKAVIREFNGGRYGRPGEYIAIIEPEYFKNGNFKKGSFHVVERLQTVRKGYGYGNCSHSEQIADILAVIE